MRKTLASIVDYKLGNKNVVQLITIINNNLAEKPYPKDFKKKIAALSAELSLTYQQDPQDTSTLMEIIDEMQKEIVDFLTLHEQPSAY